MKTIMHATLTMMAITASGCTTPTRANATIGRVIEYKSDASGFDTKTFFYEGAREVVAIDAQFTPELAKKSIEHLRKFTSKPITWLVVTHPNPDKFNGAAVFKAEGAKVIASENTQRAIPGVHAYKEYFFVEVAKMFPKGSYPQQATIDQTFIGQTDLVLAGGERLRLQELQQPGVSSTQTVLYAEATRNLFVGDLIHNRAHAWLEGGIENGKATFTKTGWIADLKELAGTYPSQTTVYGGRGVAMDLQTSVAEQIAYLQTAQKIVNAELALPAGPSAPNFYQNLAAKFRQQYPDYELTYMIEYGAYGIVQSRTK